ncbi:lysyl oxidase family protein [Paractinoplanes rishiriensis]|uniref:Uncharacterized protein n=1 Tax=Paractinoplanes rishiriensis TaxID=1050105 RepID=A0A919K1T5_9ACTN|nr:lysyl oxidase family protein [Actinoplanes rishiriensis]GIE97083.1 hypothetical protein Ari01nite_45480 [Actinoplanes rishiriensis]
MRLQTSSTFRRDLARSLRRVVPVLLATALAVYGMSAAADAADPTKIKLTSAGPAKLWAGSVSSTGPVTPSVPECAAVHCDRLTLVVDLPDNVWRKPGGVQVAVRWDGATEGALGLFVYRGRTLVAKSTAGVGLAQSLLLRSATDGTYTIYVSYGVTFGAVDPDPVIPYEALAEVEYDPAAKPVRNLLPDLKSLPQENVTYDNPGTIFGDTAQPGQSCFDSERTEHAAVQCLRFDQVLQNIGEGPVELRFNRQAGVRQDEPVVQRIFRSAGGYTDRDAGLVEFHPVHGHYHFKGFAQSDLWLADSTGKVVGTAPAAEGDKVSFCVADTDLVTFGRKGDAPMSYPAPDCLDPKSVEGTTEYFWYGMSRGWADRYNWYLPDQYIDTSGLADGTYVLFTRVDPENKLQESSDTNNCGSVIVRLSGLATETPAAQLLGSGPACV